jgi:hypothetical protein
MGLVFACACGLAVLRCASPFWSEVSAVAVTLVLLTATVGAVKGRHRTAWLGFAVFGCGTAVAAWAFAIHEAVSNEPASVRTVPSMTIPHTPLTDLLDTLYPVLHYAPPGGAVNGVRVRAIRSGVVYASFQWVGHAVACLLSGCLGSVVAVVFEARGGARPSQSIVHDDRSQGSVLPSKAL